MSVVGVDFGTLNTVIAVARNRGVDVITNEVCIITRFLPGRSHADDGIYVGLQSGYTVSPPGAPQLLQ